jgi:hypothetical protein
LQKEVAVWRKKGSFSRTAHIENHDIFSFYVGRDASVDGSCRFRADKISRNLSGSYQLISLSGYTLSVCSRGSSMHISPGGEEEGTVL